MSAPATTSQAAARAAAPAQPAGGDGPLPGPLLHTERLLLRPPAARDLAALTAYYGTPRSAGNGGPRDAGGTWRTLALHLGHWQLRGFGMFALTCRGGGDRAIGLAGPWYPGDWPEREIGWMLFSPEDEGKGLAFEAARAVLGHAFDDLGWRSAVSYIRAGKRRSRALATRLGARLDPTALPPPVAAPEPILVYRHPRPEPQGTRPAPASAAEKDPR